MERLLSSTASRVSAELAGLPGIELKGIDEVPTNPLE
jgi:hypothetical protein